MTRYIGQGYKHKDENRVHLFTECPDGSLISIPKRDAVLTTDEGAMAALEMCPWCLRKAERETPVHPYIGQ